MTYAPFKAPSNWTACVPGDGFSGATSQPGVVGSGSTAKPAARWNVVQQQVVTGSLRIGIVAFHRHGIDRVEFSANGGAWASATQMTYNPDSDSWDYNVWLDLSAEDDGQIEVRARVYPATAGTPRLLAGDFHTSTAGDNPAQNGEYSLWLWNNRGGTYDRTPVYADSVSGNDTTGNGTSGSPYATISKCLTALAATYGSVNYCTVYLKAGTYAISGGGTCNSSWVTYTPAPGVDADDITLTYGSLTQRYTRFLGLNIRQDPGAGTVAILASDGRVVWLDQCDVSAVGGRYATTQSYIVTCKAFVTGCTWHDIWNGVNNSSTHGAILVRATSFSGITADVLNHSELVVDVTIDDVDESSSGAHPDIWQLYAPGVTFDNLINFGVRVTDSTAQGIYPDTVTAVTNSAWVNVLCTSNVEVVASQINAPMQHLMVWNCTFDQRFGINDEATTFDSDCSFVGNLFRYMTVGAGMEAQVAAATFASNHYIDNTTSGHDEPGTDATEGGTWEDVVVDRDTGSSGAPATSDYNPKPASSLLARFTRKVPIDIDGVSRPASSSVGAYE